MDASGQRSSQTVLGCSMHCVPSLRHVYVRCARQLGILWGGRDLLQTDAVVLAQRILMTGQGVQPRATRAAMSTSICSWACMEAAPLDFGRNEPVDGRPGRVVVGLLIQPRGSYCFGPLVLLRDVALRGD